MSQIFTADDIDFDLYMQDTEPQQKVRSAGCFTEDVVHYFHGEKTPGASLPWRKTKEKIRFRPAEVTLWSGMNGHGKSLVLGQMSLGFVTQRQKVCILSFEMRPVVTLARICRQAMGCSVPGEQDIRDFTEITDPWIYLYDQQGAVRADQVLAVLRYAASKLDVGHVIIDSFMKCGIPEDGPNAFNAQKEFLDKLTSIARDTGMHIHLVAHSRKQKDELAPPGKMDVKGSGSITDQVDNVITVWRNKAKERELQEKGVCQASDPDAMLIVDKQRNGEWEGRIGLWFVPEALQYVESQHGMPMDMLRPV